MKKVQLHKGVMKVHYNAPQRIIDRSIELANQYLAGGLTPRKLSNGKLYVINVDTNNRIVIKGESISLYEHQQYNKKVKNISR
ncbi:putative YafQ-like ribonuclease toxin [Klebsiella phage Muenster]|nr:putative YafQ-like ribonuclease toxin [Klebsiella phage Muenster]